MSGEAKLCNCLKNSNRCCSRGWFAFGVPNNLTLYWVRSERIIMCWSSSLNKNSRVQLHLVLIFDDKLDCLGSFFETVWGSSISILGRDRKFRSPLIWYISISMAIRFHPVSQSQSTANVEVSKAAQHTLAMTSVLTKGQRIQGSSLQKGSE